MSWPRLSLCGAAQPAAARTFRHALRSYLERIGVRPEVADDIALAVGEALANTVEHAYRSRALGDVSITAQKRDDSTIVVDVVDHGIFDDRGPKPGRGFGLRIARAIARSVTVDRRGGTRVQMVFDTRLPPRR